MGEKGRAMKPEMKDSLVQLSNNPKVQAFGATFTTASGMGTVLNYLPDALGVVATMTGIMFTWVMIRKGRLDAKKIRLEIKLMKKEHLCEACKDNRRDHDYNK